MDCRWFLWLAAVAALLAAILACGPVSDPDDDDQAAPDDDHAPSVDDDQSPAADDDDDDNNDNDNDNDAANLDDCSSGYMVGDIFYQRVIGGQPGQYGVSLARAGDNEMMLAATKGEAIVAWRQAGDGPWIPECVTHLGDAPQLAVDGAGVVHLLYTDTLDHTVIHAIDNGGSWDRQTVPGITTAGLFRVAADGSAFVTLSLEPATLAFTTDRDGEWTVYPIASFPDEQYFPEWDFAIDADNRVHAVFALDWRLRLGAETDDGVFAWTEVFGHPSAPSLTVRPDGGVNLAANTSYFAGISWTHIYYWWIPEIDWEPSLTYGVLDGDAFQLGFVDLHGDPHWGALQATDSGGGVHLLYESTAYPTQARYASNQSGDWAASDVSLDGEDAFINSLALDRNDRPRVAYADWDAGSLRHATRDGENWRRETVDKDPFNIGVPTLSLGPSGQARVFVPVFCGPLTVVENVDGRWQATLLSLFDRVSGAAAVFVGDDAVTRLAVANSGGDDLDQLFYADDSSGQFERTLIDSAQYGVVDPSIAADAQGAAHVLYRKNVDGGGAMYADNAGGAWTTRLIEAIHDVSGPGAIAVEPGGRSHLLYVRQYSDDTLRYGIVDGDDVTLETVAEPVDRDGNVGLVLDAARAPHICYATDDGVRYASRGQAWTAERVAALPSSSYHVDCALQLDASGLVHLVYDYDGLYYVTNAGGAWTSVQIADYGDSLTMALDNQGQVRVAYYRMGVTYASFPQGLGAK